MFAKYILDLQKEFSGYNYKRFLKDLFAGITTCAVALPLALAFGVASGADAAAGLITAIIAGFVISALSGASFQISGPTGAMTAILIPISMKFGINGIFIIGLFAGVILVIVGVLKLGRLVSFIPSPVIVGFTSGIAIIIALGQLDNVLGMKSVGGDQISRIISYFTSGTQINFYSVLITLAVILFMIVYPKRLSEKVPSSLVAIILAIIISKLFTLPVDTIGEIPNTLFLPRRLNLLEVDFSQLYSYLVPAISVACLALVESLLCGACGGNLKGEKMDADREVISQGIGNIIIPFFGGVPATAAIARTSVAIKSGAVTRVCGIIHAAGLVVSMLLLGTIMGGIPLSALAGVLIVTAWRMNEWDKIGSIFRKKFKSTISLFLVTMLCTIVFDLTVAIVIGVILALAIYVVKSSNIEVICEDIDLDRINADTSKIIGEHDKWGVVYITGPLYFATCDKIFESLHDLEDKDTIIFSMRGVTHADDEGVHRLMEYYEKKKAQGQQVLFSSIQPSVMKTFSRVGLVERAESDSFYFSVDKALCDLMEI